VTYSPALKWMLIVLIPLTIGWKLMLKPEDPVEIQNAIAVFLAEQKFEVVVSDENLEYMHIVDARSPSCHLRVARVSPLGHEADLIRRLNELNGRTYFVFRRVVYSDQPVYLTVVNYIWFRFLRELGFVSRVPPVLAVVASCETDQLPWSMLRSLEPT
jgi:hypothetical protein